MTRDLSTWLRRALITLAVLTGVLLASGGYLTFRYRPEPSVQGPGVSARPRLVALAQAVHVVGGYSFVLVALVVVGLALAVATRRDHAVGVIAASGLGLVLVAVAFVLTGRRLTWTAFDLVGTAGVRSFGGIIGFPSAVRAVIVHGGPTTPSRYEALAWIHIAGLPVFAVFAAWWLLGALSSGRRVEADRAAAADRAADAEGRGAGTGSQVTLAEQLFGTDDPDTVRLQVDAFLHRHLRSGISALDFTRVGAGIVLGVRLDDGTPVVVKLFPPGTNLARLVAVQDVQLQLAAQGHPAPRPLLGPQPFGVGLATVECRQPEPPPSDPTDRAVRRALAMGLAALVREAAPLARYAELGGHGPLAPAAPDSAFPDGPSEAYPAATRIPDLGGAGAPGTGWIEQVGGRARMLLEAAPPTVPVVGHFAWRTEHAPIAYDRVVAVFDWSHVGTAPEPVVLGAAACQLTLDWRMPDPRVPTLEEVREFVTDYEESRGTPLSATERVMARTAYVYCTASAARTEHALALAGQAAPVGFGDQLAAHGAALLT